MCAIVGYTPDLVWQDNGENRFELYINFKGYNKFAHLVFNY